MLGQYKQMNFSMWRIQHVGKLKGTSRKRTETCTQCTFEINIGYAASPRNIPLISRVFVFVFWIFSSFIQICSELLPALLLQTALNSSMDLLRKLPAFIIIYFLNCQYFKMLASYYKLSWKKKSTLLVALYSSYELHTGSWEFISSEKCSEHRNWRAGRISHLCSQ